MARGAASQENLLNQQAGTQFQNSQNLYNTASSGYNSVLANPGFTPAQINTQMNAALTPIAGQTASAQSALTRRAAASGNTAGMVAGQDNAARTGAQLGSQAAYSVQSNADQTALNERDKALQGLSSLYGTTASSAGNLYGEATNAMNARPSVLQDISQGANVLRTILPAGGKLTKGY